MGKLKTEMLPRLLSRPQRSGLRVGRIVTIATDGRPMVDFPGNEFGPIAARVTASVKPGAVQRALERGSEVLLAFGGAEVDGPILFDVVRSRARRSPKIPDQTPLPTAETTPLSAGARLGRIIALQEEMVLVDFDGNEAGPKRARTTVPLRNLKDAVLLQFLPGGEPVIVGQFFAGVPIEEAGAEGAELVLKGRSVRIEAETEVILTAGGTQIHLDARGKAVTTADQIVSRSRGANKVQGGSVQLN